jgi:hypothetical protein
MGAALLLEFKLVPGAKLQTFMVIDIHQILPTPTRNLSRKYSTFELNG